MRKIYIVYYDFTNTSGNHAGMSYLVHLLEKDNPQVKAIKNVPHNFPTGKYIAKTFAILLALYFKIVLAKKDKVFFFEYLTKGTAYQALTAKTMRFLKINNPIYGLIHLSGKHLTELYKNEHTILNGIAPLNKIFVLGSSLKHYFKELGFEKEIVKSFHYVDTHYYKPNPEKPAKDNLQVICIGNLKRNFSMLQSIISKTPNITFHILMGANKLQSIFANLNNVKTYPFLAEEEMLQLMQKCDVSLSVMEDTIGSNVITSSMAVGLVQVVSNVGSIKDYCDTSNSFLCSNETQFIQALQSLNEKPELVEKMREKNLEKAEKISSEAFFQHFKEVI